MAALDETTNRVLNFNPPSDSKRRRGGEAYFIRREDYQTGIVRKLIPRKKNDDSVVLLAKAVWVGLCGIVHG